MMKYSAMKGGKRPGEYLEKGGRKIFAEREVSKKAEAIRNGGSAIARGENVTYNPGFAC